MNNFGDANDVYGVASQWVYRYSLFAVHWNMSIHYYRCSVTMPNIIKEKDCLHVERDIKVMFWTFMIIALATTSPIEDIDNEWSIPLLLTLLIVIMIPYAITFICLILALKNIRTFLIDHGRRDRLNLCWMFAHALAFALFFVCKLVGIIVNFFDLA